MGRTSRTAPLPDVPRGSVPDAATQRIITAIVTSLQAVLKFLKPYAEPEPWKPLPLESDVSNYSTAYQVAQYRKDAFGRVHVRAEVAVTGAHGGNHVLAVLPVNYRPPSACIFVVGDSSGSATGAVGVETTGEIVHLSGTHTHISMHFSFDPAGL